MINPSRRTYRVFLFTAYSFAMFTLGYFSTPSAPQLIFIAAIIVTSVLLVLMIKYLEALENEAESK
jgi:hypothetical protein